MWLSVSILSFFFLSWMNVGDKKRVHTKPRMRQSNMSDSILPWLPSIPSTIPHIKKHENTTSNPHGTDHLTKRSTGPHFGLRRRSTKHDFLNQICLMSSILPCWIHPEKMKWTLGDGRGRYLQTKWWRLGWGWIALKVPRGWWRRTVWETCLVCVQDVWTHWIV